MSKKGRSFNILVLIFLILVTFSFSVLAGDLLPLQGNVDLSGTPVSSGGLVVEIWDGPDVAGSNLVYNSTDYYTGTGNISAGKFDIVLGSVGDELNLEYGKVYYFDLFIAGNDMNFSGQERQVFMSSVGIINSSFLNTSNDYEFNSLLIDNKTAISTYLNISDGATPKFIVDSAGNVGINTPSPNYKLDVYGDINTTGFLLNVSNCAYGLVTDVNGLVYCSPTSFIFDDESINASIANLDTQVYNNATERVADNTTLTGMINAINPDSYNPTSIAFLNETTLNDTYARMDEANNTYARLNDANIFTQLNHFQANVSIADNLTVGGNKFYVDSSSGNVGIGTTTPSALLDVAGSQVLGSALAANLSGVLYVNESNVGIGTTSPGAKLEVYGGNIIIKSTSDPKISFRHASDSDLASIYRQSSSGNLYINSNEGANIILNTTGNVGIGTTTPAYKLQVEGTTNTTGLRTEGLAHFLSNVTIDDNLTVGGNKFYVDSSSGNVGIGTTTPSALLDVAGSQVLGSALAANLSGVLYVNESNVGIGTTSPTYSLDIYANVGYDSVYNGIRIIGRTKPYLRLESSSDSDYRAVLNVDYNFSHIVSLTGYGGYEIIGLYSGTNVVLAATSGKVGIGTTTPDAKLQINGDLNVSQGANFATSSGSVGIGTTVPAYTLQVEGTINTTGLRAEGLSRFLSNVTMDDNLTVGGNTLYVEPISGRVGIGTTSPGASLEIVNSSAVNALFNVTDGSDTRFLINGAGQIVVGGSEAPENSSMLLTIIGGDLNVSGAVFSQGLVLSSPFVVKSAGGEPIPVCMKNAKGNWVGCMPDENNNWVCEPNRECDKKVLGLETTWKLKGEGASDEEVDRKVGALRQKFEQGKSLETIKDEVRIEIGTLSVLDELDDKQPEGEPFGVQTSETKPNTILPPETYGEEINTLRDTIESSEGEIATLKTLINTTQLEPTIEQLPQPEQPTEPKRPAEGAGFSITGASIWHFFDSFF